MGIIIMSEGRNRHACRSQRATQGYSLAETLVALLIVLLLTSGIATGMAFAARQYKNSMIDSGARTLGSTLMTILQNELGNTNEVTLKNGDELDSYFTRNYAVAANTLSRIYSVEVSNSMDITESSSGYGQLWVGQIESGVASGKLMLSSASYSAYHLQVKAAVTYDGSAFHVTLKIRTEDGTERESLSFDVIPLNSVT